MSNKKERFQKGRFLLSTLRFNRSEFFNGLLIALLFSQALYFNFFGLDSLFLNSAVAVYAFYRLLKANQGTLLVTGFFIGLFWFYWVGFSFIYVDMAWVIPLVAIFFATGYSLSFWLIGFSSKIYVRLPLIFLLSFYDPLYFNWFRPELLLVHSYFGVALWQYALFLTAIALFIFFQKRRFAPWLLLLLFLSVDYTPKQLQALPFDVKVEETAIDQKKKWQRSELSNILQMNFGKIEQAIKEGKELIVLPESTLPLYLNLYESLRGDLKALSLHIDIIIGSLYVEENKPYNATYYYHKGREEIAKKMILVPFGEYIPLPKFIRKYINDSIFQGGEDYETASAPTDFEIKGVKVRSAICYEATCELFYEDDVRYISAISNNAWFQPSIEPTLQKLLITLYAKRHGVTVMHSVNGSASEIITPFHWRGL